MFAGKWSRPRIGWVTAVMLVLVAAAAIIVVRGRSTVELTQAPFSDLLRDLDRGVVSDVVVNGDTLAYTLTTGQTLQSNAPLNYVTANPSFIADMAKRGVRINVRRTPDDTAYSYGALFVAVT